MAGRSIFSGKEIIRGTILAVDVVMRDFFSLKIKGRVLLRS